MRRDTVAVLVPPQQSLFDTALAQDKTLNRPNFAYDTSFYVFSFGKYQYSTKESRGLSPLEISMENMTIVMNTPVRIVLRIK